jgi:hypothetical protein
MSSELQWQHLTATILITADIDQVWPEIQHRYPTLHLKPAATVREFINAGARGVFPRKQCQCDVKKS